MPKFDDRFARQNRYEPPPEFPLASPYSGIDHHLSGPNRYAPTQIYHINNPDRSMVHFSHQSLSFRTRVWHPTTRIYVRLLGPCFKTGRLKPFRQNLSSVSHGAQRTAITSRRTTCRPLSPPQKTHPDSPPLQCSHNEEKSAILVQNVSLLTISRTV